MTTNDTGIQPLEYRVLIRLEPQPDKIGSVHVPDQYRERLQMAGVRATLIAVGGLAFTQDNGEPWPDAPKPGDQVVVEQYSGQPPKAGDLECLLRVCNDKDVVAVLK